MLLVCLMPDAPTRSLTSVYISRAVDEWLSRGTVVRQPGSIGKLSTEVLDMIFQAILDETTESFATNLLSCICLAVGCKRLLTVGKRHIMEGLLEHHATAAQCRLVCLGESTDATDQAPPGMLTEEELKEIAATKIPGEDDKWAIAARNEEGADPNLILERCLYQFATEFYEHAGDATWQRNCALSDKCIAFWKEELKALWKEELEAQSEWDEVEPRERQPEDLLHILDRKMVGVLASYGAMYPSGPNVLLNLEKGEYVREAALTVFGKDPEHITLVHMMLSRICYSQDPGVADELCRTSSLGGVGESQDNPPNGLQHKHL